jgi:hypothetical protein
MVQIHAYGGQIVGIREDVSAISVHCVENPLREDKSDVR